jgi:hypothetical protein
MLRGKYIVTHNSQHRCHPPTLLLTHINYQFLFMN